MQKPIEGQVVVGVDTHKEIHVAAAVDWRGTLVDEKSFATTRQGYRQLESWARSLGDVLRVGVECSGSYGSGLTRHLAKNGFTVLEVTFPDKTVRRKRGKDDFIDAEMAAEAAFTGTRTVTPKARDGMVESLRMLQKTRSTAVAARRSALQMIRAIIISAPEELRDQLRGMTRMQLIRHLVATRPDSTDFKSPTGSARIALKRLAKRYVDLDDEIDELDDMIKALLEECAPLLVRCSCVGAQSATQLMVTVGDNPERLKSEAAFAMLCGVAPVPVSSGMTYRHRLNRGGDRQANSAIHIIAIGRLRTDQRTQDYVAKKLAEGHTKMEALRCLKRYIAREMYYVIKRQYELVMGWQYQHAEWCGRLEEAGIVQSMSRKGNCIDNGATEQVFGHLKDEFFRNRVWPSFDAFKRDLDAYVVHWNTRRRQVKLKGLTPEEFRNQSLNTA